MITLFRRFWKSLFYIRSRFQILFKHHTHLKLNVQTLGWRQIAFFISPEKHTIFHVFKSKNFESWRHSFPFTWSTHFLKRISISYEDIEAIFMSQSFPKFSSWVFCHSILSPWEIMIRMEQCSSNKKVREFLTFSHLKMSSYQPWQCFLCFAI